MRTLNKKRRLLDFLEVNLAEYHFHRRAAADLDAAVAGLGELDLEVHFEVLVLLLAAQEGVELDAVRRGGADDGMILDAPKLIEQAFEPVKVLAVEEMILIAGLYGREGKHD